MHADAAAVDARLPLVAPPLALRPTSTSTYPRELPKREIEITEAAQRLANALHLHLD